MKSDIYTKSILTVIALSLSVIAIELTTKNANAQAFNAQSKVQLVAICNPDGKNCADINSDFQLRISSR
jgi:hypothetical protein